MSEKNIVLIKEYMTGVKAQKANLANQSGKILESIIQQIYWSWF